MHACSAAPRGRAYLTSLEHTIAMCRGNLHIPYRPDKDVEADLNWWTELLQSGNVSRHIYTPVQFSIPLAFSDTSSGIGIGIVIGDRWCTWRLVPGWKTANNAKRDIGWAKAVGFELLVYTIASIPSLGNNVIVFGDNTGVVEGWWKGHHHNKAINNIFKRIHDFIHCLLRFFKIRTEYVASSSKPADEPSRGRYGPTHLLLPEVRIPHQLRDLIVDATHSLTPTEFRLSVTRSTPLPQPKLSTAPSSDSKQKLHMPKKIKLSSVPSRTSTDMNPSCFSAPLPSSH